MTNWISVIRQLKKLNKRMKADARLEQHYNEWLKEHYGLNNEQEILEAFKENPDLIKDMVDHWEVIKNRW